MADGKGPRVNLTRQMVVKKLLVFFGFYLLFVLLYWNCLPKDLFRDSYSTVLLDRDGKLLGAGIADDEQWRFPPVKEVNSKFVKALTCYEDKRFFSHHGVDPLALLRAGFLNIKNRQVVSGGSTLTMQLIRLRRKNRPRTLGEKWVEMILAYGIEFLYSKQEILALFSAHAPFGGNVVGLEAASWRYFGRRPEGLSWAENAMLAVLPNSPALIHLGRNRKALLEKRNRLLDRMQSKGIITGIESVMAKKEPLPPSPHPLPRVAPHLLNRVRQEITSRLHTSTRVKTTLIKDIQIKVAGIVKRHHKNLKANGVENCAVLVLGVERGQVLAYVGNVTDFKDNTNGSQVDIIRAARSTGSILKPLLYAAMVETGELLPYQLVADIPTRIGGYVPENFSKTFLGAVPAAQALARSLNIPAVRMLRRFGVERFHGLLKKLGMTTLHRSAQEYGLSLILGGAEASLWDLTGIYASIARRVTLYEPRKKREPSNPFSGPRYVAGALTGDTGGLADAPLNPAACYLALSAMLEVERPEEESAWRHFDSSQKIAWKTGTSYGFRDAWAIGVTSRYVVGVWAGNADGEGRPGLTGSGAAAPILFDVFGLLPESPWFDPPFSELKEVEVCAKSGYRLGRSCADSKTILVPKSALHSQVCPYCRIIHLDATGSFRVTSSCEQLRNMRAARWFVLPPALEWYYRRRHADYLALPPFRKDCTPQNRSGSVLSLVYPDENGQIYVPVELDGQQGKTVCQAAHRNPQGVIYWHLDEEYLGSTRELHQMAISPQPGPHTLLLVDDQGEEFTRRFTILK